MEIKLSVKIICRSIAMCGQMDSSQWRKRINGADNSSDKVAKEPTRHNSRPCVDQIHVHVGVPRLDLAPMTCAAPGTVDGLHSLVGCMANLRALGVGVPWGIVEEGLEGFDLDSALQ